MKKPLIVALLSFIFVLAFFVTRTSGFTPSPSPSPKPKTAPSPAPKPKVEEVEPEPIDIKYKGACDWKKFTETGCDPVKGWCDDSVNMCTTDFTRFKTYGKSGGICITDEDCETSGAKCNLTPPQTLYGKCSK